MMNQHEQLYSDLMDACTASWDHEVGFEFAPYQRATDELIGAFGGNPDNIRAYVPHRRYSND